MTTTIHGWPVLDSTNDPRCGYYRIPGTKRSMYARREVARYIVAFIKEYHETISPIDVGTFDDWSWSPLRTGRASSSISDHCAAMAWDLNATKEGSQGSGSLTFWRNPIKRVKLARLRRKFKLLEWGGDYKRFRDPMHWTPKYGVTLADIASETARLRLPAVRDARTGR